MRFFLIGIVAIGLFPDLNLFAGDRPAASKPGICRTALRDLGNSAYRIVELVTGKLNENQAPSDLQECTAITALRTGIGCLAAGFIVVRIDIYREHLRNIEHVYNWFTLHGSNLTIGMSWLLLLGGVGSFAISEFYMKHPRIFRAVLMTGAFIQNFKLEVHPEGIDWGDVGSGTLAVALYPAVDFLQSLMAQKLYRWHQGANTPLQDRPEN